MSKKCKGEIPGGQFRCVSTSVFVSLGSGGEGESKSWSKIWMLVPSRGTLSQEQVGEDGLWSSSL